jgi:hypothetical protein
MNPGVRAALINEAKERIASSKLRLLAARTHDPTLPGARKTNGGFFLAQVRFSDGTTQALYPKGKRTKPAKARKTAPSAALMRAEVAAAYARTPRGARALKLRAMKRAVEREESNRMREEILEIRRACRR